MRRCAADATRAFEAGDLAALGLAMSANTAAQRRLHPDLVCADADQVVAIAREHGAAGWKVNGAGGEGGSLTVLGPESADARRAMLAAIDAASPSFHHLQPTLDFDGLRVSAVTAPPAPRA
jgi:D-glycero-alpha-D-manno-heptose-7-phosphate kinase